MAFTAQYTNISSMSDYNILLANAGVPEHSTGLNKLLHTIQVELSLTTFYNLLLSAYFILAYVWLVLAACNTHTCTD